MQHERRQREVVHPVDVLGDLDLLAIVRMDLDERLHAERAHAARQSAMNSNVSGIMKQLVPGFLIA